MCKYHKGFRTKAVVNVNFDGTQLKYFCFKFLTDS